MADQIQGRNDLTEKKSKNKRPKALRKYSYLDRKEKKRSRLDKASQIKPKKKED